MEQEGTNIQNFQMVESWLIQHNMDYLIEHLFVVEYIQSGSFTAAKQAAKIPLEIMPNQFCTDSKMLYRAIKSVTQMLMPNNKYLNDHMQDKDIKTWYKFVQDYNGEYNTAAKLASLEFIIGQMFDHKHKGSIIQFIDDIDSAWAQMAHLKHSKYLDDKQKIHKFTNKITKSRYTLHASNAKLHPDGKTWESFICNLKMFLQQTEHGLVITPQKVHCSQSHCRQPSESSDEESTMILYACTTHHGMIEPPWIADVMTILFHPKHGSSCTNLILISFAILYMHATN